MTTITEDVDPMGTQPSLTPAAAYQAYYGPAIFEPLASILLSRARPSPGESVLDVACGTGIATRRVAVSVGTTGRVVGVDVNPAMLDVARAVTSETDLTVEWQHGDGTALPLPDAAFDLVLCQQGLQFFPDRDAGAREMRRVLRVGGRAVIAVWQGLEHHPLFAALADAELPELARFDVQASYGDLVAPFSFGDAAVLRDLLVAAGFRQVEVVQASVVARFPDPDRFVERLEYAYAAVVPAFAEDPAAFAGYLEAVDRRTRDVVDRHRDGDHVVIPMQTNIAIARG
ncbi:class I SAM-dependent methyltransferase [Egicoccus sp. AB-alg6-2]|uniref:class I SAM-dependent methyltransferase n=1 Tax=Egicoccus sp. AB-alg6-2 TaxID=3242692 RepID=UPI00359E9FC5